ncbi:related to REG1 - regulatory subunit for protein phosphatase Glc7p [Melanopsichium pennsylvanicum]|uniref:Related to REG1 - regulatory subunit for protein phosphatase Glc7p n=2 Tax=Melanopsichium pennsylvanicum TaxID=63383 RepID=A0AAJ4XRD3_9BASI|nr:related to REG1-regulatory subunit for protein phosphatase Glc7p [Melanopsichium pennsylvanicum 4]SNX87455.1 related to REG1 - regulatory subunit for protein phosphatase Glc7p [Melanopsichium pennsylvanicum]
MLSTPQPYPTVANNAPAPDDAQIESRMPTVCVDYLSHQWTDEDVWSSWKAMTKQKNQIANGVRLENASWRTWAKQRGNLKTISPETLNWLKDSDVTWLYGPLHEHVESVPPPKLATTADRLDLDDGHRVRSILKHRTISDMLNTPGQATSPSAELETNPIDAHMEEQDRKEAEESTKHQALFAVKSDSNLVGRAPKRIGSSPSSIPLVSAQKGKSPSIGRADSATSEEKRHISFNHRVEQCIALDHQYPDYDDYDEDEFEEEEEEDASSEEEEVLTMKSSPRSSPAISHASTSSKHSEQQATIAKLAPTRLKTSEIYPSPSPAVVDPTGFLATRANNGSTVSTYPAQYGYARAGVPPNHGDPTARGVQWDLEDDFNGDFDYFDGPDMIDGTSDHANSNGPVFNTGDAASSPDASRNYGSYFDHSESDRTDGSTSSTSPQDLTHAAPEQSQASAAPRGILKHRIVHQTPTEDYESRNLEAEGDCNVLGTSHQQESGSLTDSYEAAAARGDDSRERGRPSQRLGSSASYERIQEAARQGRGRTSSGNSSGHSPTNSVANGSYDRYSSSSTSPGNASPVTARGINATRSSGGSESFRAGAKDGARDGGDGVRTGDATAYGGKARSIANRSLNEYDSNGQGSYELASPDSLARPPLDATKDDAGSNRSSQDRDGESFTYGEERSYWSDDRKGSRASARAKSQSPSAAGGAELSVDVENIPSNAPPASSKVTNVTSPDGPVEVGPTPLNTPTFILARASGKRRSGSGSGADVTGGGPVSPTLPRRTSATGALVAPHNSEPRVPLAHDYVEEDEGGIIGRAVEIVNTARDLIGALLGTGDRGRSWREG